MKNSYDDELEELVASRNMPRDPKKELMRQVVEDNATDPYGKGVESLVAMNKYGERPPLKINPQPYKTSNKKVHLTKRAKAIIAALLIVGAIGGYVYKAEIEPAIIAYNETCEVSGYEENFRMTKQGSLLFIDVKKNDRGEITADYDNPLNVIVNERGRKEGHLIDYYDAFDDYLYSKTGEGYYEYQLGRMEKAVEDGKDPNEKDFAKVYNFDELTAKVADLKEDRLGVNK